jgi:hypothetical protein
MVMCFGDRGYRSTLDLLTDQSNEIRWWKRWTYYRSVQSLPLREAILLTDQIDLYRGMEGESITDRLDLSWPRRWTYYRSIQSLLVNDQSHKIQLEALSRLILRLANQETGGFGPLVSSHWSSRSWIPSTKRIHKPRNTNAHKVKPEALSQFDIEACVSERTYYKLVQIHYFEDESTIDRLNPTISGQICSSSWTRRQTYRRISFGLTSVTGHELLVHDTESSWCHLFGHRDVLLSWNQHICSCWCHNLSHPFGGRQDVLVSTGYSEYCITCAKITVLLYTPVYLITSKSWVLST